MPKVTREELAAVMKDRECLISVPYTYDEVDLLISPAQCEWIREQLNGQIVVLMNKYHLWIMGNEFNLYPVGIQNVEDEACQE